MYRPVEQPHVRRPSRVPLALTAAAGLVLGLVALLGASGRLGVTDARASSVGIVLRTVLAVEGGCCLVGAVLLVLRQPVGRTLTAVGGGIPLAFPVLVFPAFVIAPVELAAGVRQSGVLVFPVLIVLGALTMAQSLRRSTRDTIARHRTAGMVSYDARRW